MKLEQNIKLAPYTTYRIGGPARYFVEARNEEEIKEAKQWAQEKNVPYFVLGGGSNLLISDKGYGGLVIYLANTKHRLEGNILHADAGVLIADLVEYTVNKGLDGLQWAGGLPGQLGGAIRGNANCFGGHMHDAIKSVRAITPNGKVKTFSNRQCRFRPKTSIFKQKSGYIILSAQVCLKKGNKKELKERVNYCLDWRRNNQPKKEGTCGSVFTRVLVEDLPKDFFEKHPDLENAIKGVHHKQKFRELGTAYLIDQGLGLKGTRIGGAEVSHKHANFLVNTGDATAEHVIILASLVKSRIRRKYGITLEEEFYYLH